MTLATAKSFSVSGLAAGTAYKAYLLASDGAGNDSAVQSLSFSTVAVASSGGGSSTSSPTTSSSTEIVVDNSVTQNIASSALPLKIGSNAGGATLTVTTTQPLSVVLNGAQLTVQASAGTQLKVLPVTAGGQSLLALAVSQGNLVMTAKEAWQVLLAPGGQPVMAGRAGTQVNVSSSQIVVLNGSLVFSSNAFAALRDDILYAGEVAHLNEAGKISRVSLGSADGSGGLVGDPLRLNNSPAGLSLNAPIARLAGSVARLPEGLEKAVVAALGGNGAQNASGTLVLSGTTPRNFLPLGEILIDTDVADGVSTTADGQTRVARNGVVVTLAPAPRDLAQFTRDLQAAVPGATLTVREGGVLVARLAGVDYVVRAAATQDAANGLAGFASDGQRALRYRDGQGGEQLLYPAFFSYGDTLALINGLGNGMTGAANADGSITVRQGESSFVLLPDLALSHDGATTPPTDPQSQWWLGSDGKVYLKLGDGVQGVAVQ
jgi:hypothetical protein